MFLCGPRRSGDCQRLNVLRPVTFLACVLAHVLDSLTEISVSGLLITLVSVHAVSGLWRRVCQRCLSTRFLDFLTFPCGFDTFSSHVLSIIDTFEHYCLLLFFMRV